ncbi:MAG: lipoprotein-releasing system permease protein [Arenicella sp.]
MNFISLAIAYFRANLILPLGSLGIALGIGVLFTVISVFNGFVSELETNIRQVSGDIVVETALMGNASEDDFRKLFASFPEIASAEPQVHWFGLIGRRGSSIATTARSTDLSGVLLVGSDSIVQPATAADITPMVIGITLAEKLGLQVGDVAEIISQRPSGKHAQPVRHSFQLSATSTTGRFDQDIDRVMVNRQQLAQLIGLESNFTDWKIGLKEGADVQLLQASLAAKLREAPFELTRHSSVKSWRDVGGTLLRAAEDQKGTLAIVFGFIVLVAAYQLIATLLLLISDKRKDIGILGAVGASPASIRSFFLALSCVVTTFGVIFGLIIGMLLNANLHSVELLIGGGKPIFVPEVYKFDHIPVAVDWPQVWILIVFTYVITLLFSLIPAARATRLPIVTALRQR